MGLFGKKKEEKTCCCNTCGQDTVAKTERNIEHTTGIKILGSGCAKCNQLEANTVEALHQLGREMKIDHITDFGQIAAYGVMTTPALVVNEKVMSYGKVLSVKEIVELLEKAR